MKCKPRFQQLSEPAPNLFEALFTRHPDAAVLLPVPEAGF